MLRFVALERLAPLSPYSSVLKARVRQSAVPLPPAAVGLAVTSCWRGRCTIGPWLRGSTFVSGRSPPQVRLPSGSCCSLNCHAVVFVWRVLAASHKDAGQDSELVALIDPESLQLRRGKESASGSSTSALVSPEFSAVCPEGSQFSGELSLRNGFNH